MTMTVAAWLFWLGNGVGEALDYLRKVLNVDHPYVVFAMPAVMTFK